MKYIRAFALFGLFLIVLIQTARVDALSEGPVRPPKKEEIPALLKKLGKAKGYGGYDVARDLGLAIYEPGVVEGFIQILDGDNEWAKAAIASECQYGRNVPPELLPSLAAAMHSDNEQTREAVVQAMQNFTITEKPIIDSLVELLDDESPMVRLSSAYAVGKIGLSANEAIPQLVEMLNDNGRFCAEAAASALGAMGDGAKPYLPELVETCGKTWHLSSSTSAENVFIQLGPESYPYLIDLLASGDFTRREVASMTFKQAGPAASGYLIDALQKDSATATYAAQILLDMNIRDDRMVPALEKALENYNSEVRSLSARLLGELGADAGHAIPKLIEMMYNDLSASSDAKHAVKEIGAESTGNIDGLITLLDHTNIKTRAHAAEALGELGSRAIRAVPALEVVVDRPEEDSSVWRAAMDAMTAILPPDDAVQWLDRFFIYQLDRKAGHATELLGSLAVENDNAIVSLINALEHSQGGIRQDARQQLVKLEQRAVPWVIDALDHPAYLARIEVVRVLRDMGANAADALPALRDIAQNDPYYIDYYTSPYPVRDEALKAVRHIESRLNQSRADSEDDENGNS